VDVVAVAPCSPGPPIAETGRRTRLMTPDALRCRAGSRLGAGSCRLARWLRDHADPVNTPRWEKGVRRASRTSRLLFVLTANRRPAAVFSRRREEPRPLHPTAFLFHVISGEEQDNPYPSLPAPAPPRMAKGEGAIAFPLVPAASVDHVFIVSHRNERESSDSATRHLSRPNSR